MIQWHNIKQMDGEWLEVRGMFGKCFVKYPNHLYPAVLVGPTFGIDILNLTIDDLINAQIWKEKK